MKIADLTDEQLDRLHRQVSRRVNYLWRLIHRMTDVPSTARHTIWQSQRTSASRDGRIAPRGDAGAAGRDSDTEADVRPMTRLSIPPHRLTSASLVPHAIS